MRNCERHLVLKPNGASSQEIHSTGGNRNFTLEGALCTSGPRGKNSDSIGACGPDLLSFLKGSPGKVGGGGGWGYNSLWGKNTGNRGTREYSLAWVLLEATILILNQAPPNSLKVPVLEQQVPVLECLRQKNKQGCKAAHHQQTDCLKSAWAPSATSKHTHWYSLAHQRYKIHLQPPVGRHSSSHQEAYTSSLDHTHPPRWKITRSKRNYNPAALANAESDKMRDGRRICSR